MTDDRTPDFNAAGAGIGGSGLVAAVIHPYPRHAANPRRTPAAALDEAVGLAQAIALDVVHAEMVALSAIRPATYIGQGSVDALKKRVEEQELGLIIFDCALSPIQQRNLERATGTKVIDRTGLILEIFGERARSREGVLQVELAHLVYQQSRLVRSWTHLERQRGGVGFLGGPGETQIETDRRILREKIARLRRALDQVRRTRGLHRKRRKEAPYPLVALVGYTNAGKSSLFNRLTRAEVEAKDMLFATLDPTVRQVVLPGGQVVLLSDTVGFISNLPTQLVAAFRATLEEVEEADLILHVRDGAHPDSDAQRADVLDVLGGMGIGVGEGPPVVEVVNKLDLMTPQARDHAQNTAGRADDIVTVSALTGEGVEKLQALIIAKLFDQDRLHDIRIAVGDGAALAWLYRHGRIVRRVDGDDAIRLSVRLSDRAFAEWRAR